MKTTAKLLTIFLLFFSNFAQSQLQNYYGEYYALENDQDEFVLQENCWSMGLDQLSILAVHTSDPNKHLITFSSFHAENFVSFDVLQADDMLYVKAYLEDDPEKQVHSFEITTINGLLSVYHRNYKSETFFVKKENRSDFKFVPCPEEESNSNEEVAEIVEIETPIEKVETEESKQTRMKGYLLALLDPLFTREEIKLNEFVSKRGFPFKYPGSDPYTEVLFDASNMFQNSYFTDFIKPIEDGSWADLPVYFVKERAHLCSENDVKKGIHVRIRDLGDFQVLEVIIYLADGSGDSNAMQLQLIIGENHTLRSLFLIECDK